MNHAAAQHVTLCTIIARNYLAQARCLAESFYAQHPGGRMVTLLVDDPEGYFDPDGEPFEVVRASELGIPGFAQMAFRYSVLELSTAVKPFFLEHLLARPGVERAIYLDPDIYLLAPLAPLLEALESHAVALTPHLLAPLDDARRPSELDILQAGAYNLGCIGVARGPELLPFLRWWQRRLERDCVVDLARGLFVDQGWVDLAPSLFSGVAIVRDPGCNVAFWNLSQRRVARGPGGWEAEGRPLAFFHFSGMRVDDIERISIHQDRHTLADLPELRPLFEHYRDRMLAHGHRESRRWPYGHGQFDNGAAVPDIARRVWRAGDGESRWPEPFAAAPQGSFFRWLLQEADRSAADGLLLSNLALEVYRRRADLQQAFPDVLGAHRRDYLGWFAHDAAAQHGLDEALVEPLRAAVARYDAARQPAPAPDAWLPQLPEEPLSGRPTLSRRAYYAVRNPLRRLGLHGIAKRAIGVGNATRILQAMVVGPAAPPTRMAQPQGAGASAAGPGPARGLNLVGYLAQESGVGEVARSLLRAVEQHGYPVVGIQTPMAEIAGAAAGPYSHNLLCVNADMTPQVRRALGAPFFQGRYTIGLWHWESTSFPPEWRGSVAMLDELWVASEFVRATLAALAPVPVHRVRLPVAAPARAPLTRAQLGLPEGRFVWLFAFDARSYVERKNPLAAVEAFRRAFGERSREAHLVVRARHIEELPEEAARLRAAVESVGGALITRAMARDELGALFAACDGYVSLHRCEGFGLTLAEAMALGKPVLGTAYSGNMDFMTDENSFPVRFQMAELERDCGPYRRGTRWADPDVGHAAELMRLALDRPEEAARRGAAAAADIARLYGSREAGRGVVERLRAVGGAL